MRLNAIPTLVLLLGIAPFGALAQSTVTIPLHLHEAGEATKAVDKVQALALELLESSSLNTAGHPDVLNQSIPAIQDRYRRAVAGECLVMTYASPVNVSTSGGEVSVFEIVIGLGHPEHADAVFTIDGAGRVVAHEKYSGTIAVALRKAADLALGAR